MMVQMKISCNASVLHEDANVCTCNVYACDAWICPSMMVQMEIVFFANILQKDAYVNVIHVMQMFEPILMEVQKFIAAFLFKNRLSCLTLNFSDHHQEFFRVDQSGVSKNLTQ